MTTSPTSIELTSLRQSLNSTDRCLMDFGRALDLQRQRIDEVNQDIERLRNENSVLRDESHVLRRINEELIRRLVGDFQAQNEFNRSVADALNRMHPLSPDAAYWQTLTQLAVATLNHTPIVPPTAEEA